MMSTHECQKSLHNVHTEGEKRAPIVDKVVIASSVNNLRRKRERDRIEYEKRQLQNGDIIDNVVVEAETVTHYTDGIATHFNQVDVSFSRADGLPTSHYIWSSMAVSKCKEENHYTLHFESDLSCTAVGPIKVKITEVDKTCPCCGRDTDY